VKLACFRIAIISLHHVLHFNFPVTKDSLKHDGTIATLRDYHKELTEILTLKDPNFRPCHMDVWAENVSWGVVKEEGAAAFEAVDAELSRLDKHARRAAFDQDSLKLTRDSAQLALLYKAEAKHERAAHLQKVTHIKCQNSIGASIISKFMSRNVRHVSGRIGEIEHAIDEAQGFPKTSVCCCNEI